MGRSRAQSKVGVIQAQLVGTFSRRVDLHTRGATDQLEDNAAQIATLVEKLISHDADPSQALVHTLDRTMDKLNYGRRRDRTGPSTPV